MSQPMCPSVPAEHLCHCDCHAEGSTLVHFDACCWECPRCGEKIIGGACAAEHRRPPDAARSAPLR